MPLLPILRKSPFSRLIVLYAFGIAITDCIGNFFPPDKAILFILLILWLFLSGIVHLPGNLNTAWIAGSLAALLIFLCGIWAAEIDIKREKQAGFLPETSMPYRLLIIDVPESNGNSVKAIARVLEVRSREGWIKQNLKVLLFVAYDSVRMPRPGCVLHLNAALKCIPPPANPDEFNYRRYLATRHIYRQAFIKPLQDAYLPGRLVTPRIRACLMRNQLLQLFQNLNLEPRYLGLVSALTLGYREDVDATTKKSFTRAGVMHIMALSGFNVGIIALVLGFVLGIFGRNPAGKYSKTVIILLFLWLFALITGLSPSVTRATVMISFVMTGRLFHRRVNTYNILFVSAFLLLTFNPGMISDVSFQLSFAAVLGILAYQPVLKDLVVFKNSLANKIWQLFTLSCAAQLATFPLTLFYFHQFPVYFWLTNLYVVPLVSVILCVAGGYLAMVWLKPFALVAGKVLALLLKILLVSVNAVEKLPASVIGDVYINGMQTILLMLVIFFLAVFLAFRSAKWVPVLLLLMIQFEGIQLRHIKHLNEQQTALISSVRGKTGITFVSGRKALLLINADNLPGLNDLNYSFGNYWIKHGVKPLVISLDRLSPEICNGIFMPDLYFRRQWRGDNILVSFHEQRMVLLRDDRFYKFTSKNSLQADFLIISGKLSLDPERVAREIKTKMVILDGSVKSYKAAEWKKECKKRGIACFVIPEQGAFRIER